MDSAVVSLLSAFVLSLIGLFAFMWSMRKGLLVENPRAAGTIFAPDEVGKADDPSLTKSGEQLLQQAINETRTRGASWSRPKTPKN